MIAVLRPDLILLYFLMPVMNGFETCRSLTYIGGNAELLKLFWKNAETILEECDADGESEMGKGASAKVNGLTQGILIVLHQVAHDVGLHDDIFDKRFAMTGTER